MIFSSVLVIKFYADWQTVAFGDFSTLLHIAPLQMKCEMPTTRTKTIFQLLGNEQELRLTALPTFEDVVKSSC